MKTIGRTNDGGHLVEMTDVEHSTMRELEDAVDGTFPGLMDQWGGNLHSDLGNALRAIHSWVRFRMRVNDIKNMANQLEGVLNGEYDSNAVRVNHG